MFLQLLLGIGGISVAIAMVAAFIGAAIFFCTARPPGLGTHHPFAIQSSP